MKLGWIDSYGRYLERLRSIEERVTSDSGARQPLCDWMLVGFLKLTLPANKCRSTGCRQIDVGIRECRHNLSITNYF